MTIQKEKQPNWVSQLLTTAGSAAVFTDRSSEPLNSNDGPRPWVLDADKSEESIAECSYCRGAFLTRLTVLKPSFCSPECATEAGDPQTRAKRRPKHIVCRRCGKMTEVKQRGPVPGYCSARCRTDERKQAADAPRPASPIPDRPPPSQTPPETLSRNPPNQPNRARYTYVRQANPDPAPNGLTGTVPGTVRKLGDAEEHIDVDPSDRAAHSDMQLLRRSLQEALPYGPRIGALFVLSILETPLALLTPVPLAVAVDSALGSEPLPVYLSRLIPPSVEQSTQSVLFLAAALLVVVALLSAIQSLATTVLEASTGEKLTLRFQGKLFQHVQRLSFAFHDARGTADSIYRIQYDSKAIQTIAVQTLIPVVTALFTLGSMLVIIFRIDAILALVALGVSPFLFFYARVYRHRMRPKYKQAKRLESSTLKVVQEVLTSFRVVKAFGKEDEEKERFVSKGSESVAARIGLTAREGTFGLMVNVTTALGSATVLYIGVTGVQAGRLTLGALLLVLSYVGQLYKPLKTLSNRSASLQRQLASAERAFELLDEVPDVAERPNATAIQRAAGDIELRDVSFGYKGADNVLEHISITIAAGTRVGLAGRTGAGKTTLVSLLARFYDPDEGSILLDGVDLRDYRLKDLRAQFTIMLQEPVLFSTSIAKNVAYARPSATFEEIVTATRTAGAHEFVSALPDGYDTVVGERGMSLSGGERQRLSLARAFLYDAPILILDEPTSAVDVKTESEIMEAMEELMVGRTTFMIAHRLGTLERCDLILEIDDGRAAPTDHRGRETSKSTDEKTSSVGGG